MVAFGFFYRITPITAPRQGKQRFGKVKTCSPAHHRPATKSVPTAPPAWSSVAAPTRTHPAHRTSRGDRPPAQRRTPHRRRRTRARGGPDRRGDGTPSPTNAVPDRAAFVHHRRGRRGRVPRSRPHGRGHRRRRLSPTRGPPRTGPVRERTGALRRPARGRRRATCAPRPDQAPRRYVEAEVAAVAADLLGLDRGAVPGPLLPWGPTRAGQAPAGPTGEFTTTDPLCSVPVLLVRRRALGPVLRPGTENEVARLTPGAAPLAPEADTTRSTGQEGDPCPGPQDVTTVPILSRTVSTPTVHHDPKLEEGADIDLLWSLAGHLRACYDLGAAAGPLALVGAARPDRNFPGPWRPGRYCCAWDGPVPHWWCVRSVGASGPLS